MSSKSRRGRPTVPHKTAWGEEVLGLYKCPDGRYRINATGEKFTEHDERLAVKRFREWQENNGQELLKMEQLRVDPLEFTPIGKRDAGRGLDRISKLAERGHLEITTHGKTARLTALVADVPKQILWGYFRHMLLNFPQVVAEETGIPEIVNYRYMKLPRPSLKIADLIVAYQQHSSARLPQSRRSAFKLFKRLVDFCGATTLDHLTTEKLLAFKAMVEADPDLKSGGTKAAYFARCKTIIRFGLKVGMDAGQIRMALDRMGVLWAASPKPGVDPHPISREDFHRLLDAAVGECAEWRVWLLLALNLCLHLKDVCLLQWADFDLEAKTYVTIRRKTEDDRIPQAAILWDETVVELRKLRRAGQYVLNSSHGTHYHRTSRGNAFLDFRKAINMTHVGFDHLRDGAYTAACRSRIDDKWARLLAGHRAEGLQDSYVKRHPEIVRPACEAVYWSCPQKTGAGTRSIHGRLEGLGAEVA
jgi:hypothetical protein